MEREQELFGLAEKLKNEVAQALDFDRTLQDAEMFALIDRCILEESGALSLAEKMKLRRDIFNSFRRLDVLTDFLEDEEVTEIMVNGVSEIFVEKRGRLMPADRQFASEEKLLAVAQQIVADCNRRINETNPIVDARLSDGSRVNIVLPPVSLSGVVLTIRKFPKEKMTMEQLVELGTLSAEVAELLGILVRAKYNIFVSGGTGSGKTTFLNVLTDFLAPEERVVTIEDSAELQIRSVKNLVRLESRQANLEGENEITIRELIKTSLRMRPDRIILGEVRDAAAIDMLAAMGTGHDGSLCTGHANSAEDMISRLETMVLMGLDIPLLAVKQQIASAVDIVIHLGRMRDGSRKVKKICEVKGMEHGEILMNTLFEFTELQGQRGKLLGGLRKVNDLIHIEKLLESDNLDRFQEVGLEIRGA